MLGTILGIYTFIAFACAAMALRSLAPCRGALLLVIVVASASWPLLLVGVYLFLIGAVSRAVSDVVREKL